MTDLTQIVKSEPPSDHSDISTSSNPKNAPIENTNLPSNPTQLSLIPPLSTTSATTHTHTPSSSSTPHQHPHPNPFGPSYTTHNKVINHTIPPFPPPFSNHRIPRMPNIYPPPTYPAPPMPFPPPHSHPPTPYPVPNPMFYPPVFHYNQAAPPPSSHHTVTYDNSDSKTTHESSTTPVPIAPTNTKNTHVDHSHTANKSKPYSFTPGMQPGAYYLIPLNTPNGHGSVSNQNNGHAYMPLINGGPSSNDKNSVNVSEHHKNISHVATDTSSATSSEDSDSDSESNDDEQQRHIPQTHANIAHSVYQTPFLNVVSPLNHAQNGINVPHLPFPHIPLTPNTNAAFPPPLPLPYDLNQLNSTQFSLAPIINTNNNRVLPEKNSNISCEDKKNILKNKHETVSQTSFLMAQPPPIHINNITTLTSQPLSFPPLPTNTSMNQSSHLNSNFAGRDLNDLDDDIDDDISSMLTPERDIDDSSDHDMDTALGTHQMPFIHNNSHNHNNNKSLYHNITPFDAGNTDPTKKKRKARLRPPHKSHSQSPHKSRKDLHKNKRKVSNASHSNNYQDISVTVNIPALNKMNVPIAKLATASTTNGRRILKKRHTKPVHVQIPPMPPLPMPDIPELSDADGILIPPAITNIEEAESGTMDVAYSQQYPQVGFPFIYNAQAEKGKKFTCKFMDSSSAPTVNTNTNTNTSTSAPMMDCELRFCDRQFGQKCHWMRHCLEKHVPTEMSQRYQCRYCNMKYAQNSSLKEHVAICHSNKPPSFKCPYCSGDITFTRWTSVLRHCRNQHPDQEGPSKQLRAKSLSHSHVKKKKIKRNGNGSRRMRRNHNGDGLMDIDGSGNNLGALNIMPSVNMNISMNQMLSNNYITNVGVVPANVAILPPDLSHSNGLR